MTKLLLAPDIMNGHGMALPQKKPYYTLHTPTYDQKDRNNGDNILKLYFSEIMHWRLLDPSEEIELFEKMKNGDESARETLIGCNLRLVVSIAKEYEGCGIELIDLISEGNIGLMTAVERFDPTKGAKLSTYSSIWIKQRIFRALSNHSKMVRLPVHVINKIWLMGKASFRLIEILGRDPTPGELATELGIRPSEVRRLQRLSQKTISLEAPIGDMGRTLGDTICDDSCAAALDTIADIEASGKISELFGCLSQKERLILTKRFGLNNEAQHTLEQLSSKLGVTSERVRQIENIGLEKLRRVAQKRGLTWSSMAIDH